MTAMFTEYFSYQWLLGEKHDAKPDSRQNIGQEIGLDQMISSSGQSYFAPNCVQYQYRLLQKENTSL